ncbi:hypothetical protein ACD923_21805, partial [Escherichia coli]
FTIGEGELMAHDVPLGCAPDEYDDLVRTFPNNNKGEWFMIIHFNTPGEFLLPCRQGWTENTRRN